jgi:hypothetical protein
MTQGQLTRDDTRVCTGTYRQFSYINQQNEASARSTQNDWRVLTLRVSQSCARKSSIFVTLCSLYKRRKSARSHKAGAYQLVHSHNVEDSHLAGRAASRDWGQSTWVLLCSRITFPSLWKSNIKLTAPFSGKIIQKSFRKFEVDIDYLLYYKIDRSCSTCGLYEKYFHFV